MAAVTAAAPAVASFVQKAPVAKSARPARVAGLPSLRVARVVCSAQKKDDKRAAIVAAAATVAATAGSSLPALAVVEEVLGGEGVGLPLGVSASGFTWIITGVFTLIWALYFVYSSSLPEGDDDSGLGL